MANRNILRSRIEAANITAEQLQRELEKLYLSKMKCIKGYPPDKGGCPRPPAPPVWSQVPNLPQNAEKEELLNIVQELIKIRWLIV
jgi:hypothetical protein